MRVRTLLIILLLICCSIGTAAAQDGPPGLFPAALRAARNAKPELGDTPNWRWQRLNPTTLSNLGCPLVQGVELGREVTPYIVSVIYPDATYLVHVSADTTLTQPCDPKFGALIASTPAPASICQLAGAAQPTFRIAPDASTAVLGGEVLVNGLAYAIGRSDTREWYQTRNTSNQIGWVSANEVTANGACDPLPITGAQNIDYVTVPCFVTAAQDFSNVRRFASEDEEIIGRVYENVYYQVYATTTDGQWLFINPGWVADRVTEKYGDCDSIEVNNSLVGGIAGTPTLAPSVTFTPAATLIPTATLTPTATSTPLPADFVCPTDFKGFMTPRIGVGAATARVDEGGSPNRLRADPTIDTLQVGQAQPGRTLDRVLSGPACNGTFVWWLVEIDGIQGWTAESDSTDGGAYFLEPVAGASVALPTATSGAISIAAVTAAPTGAVVQPANSEGLVAEIFLDIQEDDAGPFPIRDIRFYDDKTVIAVAGDRYYQWDLEAGVDKVGEWTSDPVTIQALDSTDTLWYLLDTQNTLRIKNIMEDDTNLVTVTLESPVDTPTLSVTSDGRYILTVGCNNADCTQGKIDLWETATGTLIRSQPAHISQPLGAWFTPNDRSILSMGQDGLQIWDTQSGSFRNGVDLTEVSLLFTFPPAVDAEAQVYYLAVCLPASDGETDCSRTDLIGRSLETNEIVSETSISTSYAQTIGISDSGAWLAVGLNDQTIQLWQKDDSGAFVLRETYEAEQVIISLGFNEAETRLAAGADNGFAQVWAIPQP